MPAPATIVNFRDQDGDIFPIKVWLRYDRADEPEIQRIARETFEQLRSEGHTTAVLPLEVESYESCN